MKPSKGSTKEVQVECTAHVAITAVFELGEGETIEEFKEWFKNRVSVSDVYLSDSDSTEVSGSEITDVSVEPK